MVLKSSNWGNASNERMLCIKVVVATFNKVWLQESPKSARCNQWWHWLGSGSYLPESQEERIKKNIKKGVNIQTDFLLSMFLLPWVFSSFFCLLHCCWPLIHENLSFESTKVGFLKLVPILFSSISRNLIVIIFLIRWWQSIHFSPWLD